MHSRPPKVLRTDDGKAGDLLTLGVRFMVGGEQSGGGFALVEHPLPPRMLAAPLHRHSREDEYSFVLQGRIGAQLGDDVVLGGPGDLIFKPRDQWHTFWNPADEPARILEIISPAGFERFFEELLDPESPDRPRATLPERYGLDLDLDSVPGLLERHGLRFGPEEA